MRFAVFLCLMSLAGCAPQSAEPPGPPPSPNILFIAIDDLNDWVGALGGHPDTFTPNIDRLADAGVMFSNAHAQAPLCWPSRASLMSGLRPSTTGVYGITEDEQLREASPLIAEGEFLPEYFGHRGYRTMGIGKLFHNHAPKGVFEESGGREPGFGPSPEKHFHWDQPGTSTDWGPFPETDEQMPDWRSATWAIERLNREYDRPFFLAVGFLRPHVPWYVPQHWFDLHPIDSVTVPPFLPTDMDDIPETGIRMATVPPMPTTEWAIEHGQWPAMVQGYLACISFVDAQVGRVLDALEASPYADNTIVVLFSDHGYHLGEKNRFAKHALWERATRVPLVFSGPGVARGGVVSTSAELLDIYPTLVELAGLPPNGANEGVSLAGLLRDPTSATPPELQAAITTYGRNNHGLAVEDARYIRYEDGSEELYEHKSDPNEWTNLAGVDSRRAEMDSLAAFLPEINVPWSDSSNLDVFDYFREQKASGR